MAKEVFEMIVQCQGPFRGSIVKLNGSSDCRIVTNWKLTAWKALLYDNNQAIEEKDSKEQPIEKTFPNQYNVSLPLFNEIVADQLAHDRSGIYYRIRLIEGQSPTSQPL